jgi:TonB family protein
VGLGSCLSAQQDGTVLDDEIKPRYFETLTYPLAARLTHVQGAVVVRVKLDDKGKVVSSIAVSGAKNLIQDCISNSKKWRFRPNPEKAAVIVYEFRIEGLCNLPCSSQFAFRPPNVATITIGEAVVDHSEERE